jgi:hypothetical protein
MRLVYVIIYFLLHYIENTLIEERKILITSIINPKLLVYLERKY